MKKRIAIIIHGGIGGGNFSQGQPAIQQLVERMSDRYIIEVFSLFPPGQAYKSEHFKIISANKRISSRSLRWLFIFFQLISKHFRSSYNGFYAFWGYPSGIMAVVATKLLRRPSIIHLQGGDAVSIPEINYGVFSSAFRAKICRWAYKQCTLLIALTKYQKSMLLKNDVQRNIEVIPFGVDFQKFIFKTKNFEDRPLHFLHVANHTEVKDQRTMLEVFALVSKIVPATLTVVGSDFLEGQLSQWADELGILSKVKFFGAQPYERMPAFYDEAHILLHTSLYEGQGLVFIEAAATGTLIAGTCVGTLADMGDRCGLIVQMMESHQLAEKIIESIRTRSCVSLTRNARAWVDDKTTLQMDKLLFGKIEKVIQ